MEFDKKKTPEQEKEHLYLLHKSKPPRQLHETLKEEK